MPAAFARLSPLLDAVDVGLIAPELDEGAVDLDDGLSPGHRSFAARAGR